MLPDKVPVYGLKQAGHELNNELNKQLESLGWKPTIVDPCMYIRESPEGIEVVAVWVNNLLFFASNESLMNKMKLKLKSIFDITDLGEPAKIVGIKIERDCMKGTIMISQKQYIESILQKEGLMDAHPVAVTMDLDIQLQPSEGEAQDKSKSFASLVRLLMYLAMAMRPDIAYAIFRLVVKSGSTPVGGPVKSGRKRTEDKGRGLDKELVRPGLMTAWIQRLRTTSIDPLRRFWSRGWGQKRRQRQRQTGTGVVTKLISD